MPMPVTMMMPVVAETVRVIVTMIVRPVIVGMAVRLTVLVGLVGMVVRVGRHLPFYCTRSPDRGLRRHQTVQRLRKPEAKSLPRHPADALRAA